MDEKEKNTHESHGLEEEARESELNLTKGGFEEEEDSSPKPMRLIRGTDDGKPLEVEVFFDEPEKVKRQPKRKKKTFKMNFDRLKKKKLEEAAPVPKELGQVQEDLGKETRRERKTPREEVLGRSLTYGEAGDQEVRKETKARRRIGPKLTSMARRLRRSFQKKRKAWMLSILGLVLFIIFVSVIKSVSGGGGSNKKESLGLVNRVWASTEEIASVEFSSSGLSFWDRYNLAFYSKLGEEETLVTNPQLGRVFYGDQRIYAVNHLTQDLSLFDHKGEAAGYISGGGDQLFHITHCGSYDLVHQKGQGSEKLSLVSEDLSLVPLLETEEFILTYDMDKPNNYVVATMITKGNGYRSRIHWSTGGNVRNYDFNNEVIIKIKVIGSDIYAVTNDHLYWLKNGEREGIEMSLFKNLIVDGKQLWVLHGDLLECFNRQLTSQSKTVVAIDGTNFIRAGSMNYVYNQYEILGYYQNRDYHSLYYKAEDSIRDLQESNGKLALCYMDHVDIMEPVKTEGVEPPIEDEEDEVTWPVDVDPEETKEVQEDE